MFGIQRNEDGKWFAGFGSQADGFPVLFSTDEAAAQSFATRAAARSQAWLLQRDAPLDRKNTTRRLAA